MYIGILFEFSMGKIDREFKVHVSLIALENKLILLEAFVLKTYPYLFCLKALFIFDLDMYAKNTKLVTKVYLI